MIVIISTSLGVVENLIISTDETIPFPVSSTVQIVPYIVVIVLWRLGAIQATPSIMVMQWVVPQLNGNFLFRLQNYSGQRAIH